MKLLHQPDRFVTRYLSPQLIEEGIRYEESKYLIKHNNAVYNVLTGEAVLVTDINADMQKLIRRWFYVPENFDVRSLEHAIRQNKLNGYNYGPGSKQKYSYTIFTTTTCNASCIYCFEKNYPVITMDEQTAKDVAEYIKRTCVRDDRGIKLRWFGGEPLVNSNVIDIICNDLGKSDIKFYSDFTTNGDLLPSYSDETITNKWHTRQVQLTLDDIGPKYGEFKGLDSNAYERLKQTVYRLSGLGVKVLLRVHLHPDSNPESKYCIVNEFSGNKNIRAYVRLLYGSESREAYERVLKLEDYMIAKGISSISFPRAFPVTHCMADNSRDVCITPEGKLSICEHYPYGENLYGSIYSPEIDGALLRKWSTREKYVNKKCRDCVFYPSCPNITLCPAEGLCSDAKVFHQVETIKRALRKKVSELYGGDSNTNN